MCAFYSKIIITNLPAFYKVNLFNEISKHESILVIFTGNTANIRNSDFFKEELINFNYVNLKNKAFITKFLILIKILFSNKFLELILGGWDEPLQFAAWCFTVKAKKSLIVESSIYESTVKGFKSRVKKLFLKGISKAYVSGKSQLMLVKMLGFKGIIKKTKGVGVFNIQKQPQYEERQNVSNFLYVGRLSREKNLETIINLFNEYPHLFLHIIGFGPDEEYLRSLNVKNVVFHGAINNDEIYKYYQLFDVFILPSKSEPWGLVVEEALNNGMPVIVSNKVGCSDEIVEQDYNGLVFNVDDLDSLRCSISKIQSIKYYNSLRLNVSKMNFFQTVQQQVKCYL